MITVLPEIGSFMVPSESQCNVLYEVDCISGVCSCSEVAQGKCCKHQIALSKFYQTKLPNAPAVKLKTDIT